MKLESAAKVKYGSWGLIVGAVVTMILHRDEEARNRANLLAAWDVRAIKPRLLTWDPPQRVVFGWHLGPEWKYNPDPALSTEVEVRFIAEGTGTRVELEHLSENSFGSLVPALGYFYLKSLIDFIFALVLLPFALPLMAVVALAIRLDVTEERRN